MTTTPTYWLGEFINNPNSALLQANPRIIGLKNGNFLALWDDDNDATAPGIDRDIVGVIYDAEGHIVKPAFQLNNNFNIDNEESAAVGALPGGGFVVVYEDNNAGGTSIRAQHYDADGNLTGGATTIATDPGAPTLHNPSVAVNSDGSFLVTYEHDDGTNETIRSKLIATEAIRLRRTQWP